MTQATLATLGTIGIWLLVAAGLVLIVELVLVAVWGAAMSRRMLALSQSISSQRAGYLDRSSLRGLPRRVK